MSAYEALINGFARLQPISATYAATADVTAGQHREKRRERGAGLASKDYLELVDDTGRIIRDDKRGAIGDNSTKLLTRLNISQGNWLRLTTEFGKLFHGPVLLELTHYCTHLGKRRRHFATGCQHLNAG